MASCRTETWTRNLLNMKQGCAPLRCSVSYLIFCSLKGRQSWPILTHHRGCNRTGGFQNTNQTSPEKLELQQIDGEWIFCCLRCCINLDYAAPNSVVWLLWMVNLEERGTTGRGVFQVILCCLPEDVEANHEKIRLAGHRLEFAPHISRNRSRQCESTLGGEAM